MVFTEGSFACNHFRAAFAMANVLCISTECISTIFILDESIPWAFSKNARPEEGLSMVSLPDDWETMLYDLPEIRIYL
jgi:hypothetical protein